MIITASCAWLTALGLTQDTQIPLSIFYTCNLKPETSNRLLHPMSGKNFTIVSNWKSLCYHPGFLAATNKRFLLQEACP